MFSGNLLCSVRCAITALLVPSWSIPRRCAPFFRCSRSGLPGYRGEGTCYASFSGITDMSGCRARKRANCGECLLVLWTRKIQRCGVQAFDVSNPRIAISLVFGTCCRCVLLVLETVLPGMEPSAVDLCLPEDWVRQGREHTSAPSVRCG